MFKNVLKKNTAITHGVMAVAIIVFVIAWMLPTMTHASQNAITIGQTVTGTSPTNTTPSGSGGGGGTKSGGTGFVLPQKTPVTPTPVPPAVGPENVSNFTAVAHSTFINLSWQNPQTPFDAIRIVRSDKFYPRDPLDGKIIFEGVAAGVVDTSLVAGTTYYYTAFTVVGSEYSSGVITSADAVDVFAHVPESPDLANSPPLEQFSVGTIRFSQAGKLLVMSGDYVDVAADQSIHISVPYESMPEILKTIIMTVYTSDDHSKNFSFLLRVNADKTVYEATIAPLEKAGRYAFGLAVLNYKNESLKKVTGTIVAHTPPLAAGSTKRAFEPVYVFYGLLSAAFLGIVIRLLLVKKMSASHIQSFNPVWVAVIGVVAAAAFIAGSLFVPQHAFAALNKQINYQGKLIDSSNATVSDGAYHMRFKLYTTPTGGVPIWSEDRSTALGDRAAVTSGLFSVMLGSSTPFTGVDFNQTLYLGVEIGGSGNSPLWDGEMTPRKVLGAVPAAFVADTVDGISSEEFLRSDATNSTSTASTFLSFVQSGAGAIASFIGQSSAHVLDILSNGNVGIGTSTPYARLSVAGQTVAAYFTATTSTASIFPYASTTALTVSGTNGLSLGSLTGILQAINGTVSASSSLSVAFGGTGRSTAADPGSFLVGNTSGGYDSLALDSLPVSSGQLSIANGGTGSNFPDDYVDNGIMYLANSHGSRWFKSVDNFTYDGAFFQQKRFGPVDGSRFADWVDENGNSLIAFSERGYIGIGTSTPYAPLSVNGQAVAAYFTATTSTASVFPYASTTALTVGGSLGLSLGSLTGPLQAQNGQVSATSSVGVVYGGTGLTTAPSYGNILVGNSAGGYTLTSTSTLKIALSDTTGTLAVNRGGTGVASFGGTNTLLYTTSANTISSINTANSSFLVTDSGGTPSWSTTMPAHTLGGLVTGNSQNITGLGQLAVGTTSPNNLLDLYSTTKSALGFSGASGSTYKWTMGMDVSNGGRFSIASSTALGTFDRLVIDGNGNVGIGTTSPYSMLSVAGQIVGQNYVATSSIATSTFAGPTIFSQTGAATYRLDQIYGRLTQQYASVFFIGDSTASPQSANRWLRSIQRKWDVPWAGVTTLACNSSADVFSVFNLTTPCASPIASGAAWGDGSGNNDTIFPGITTTGPNLVDHELVNLSQYARGDWTKTQNLTTNIMMHKATSQFTTNVSQEYFRGIQGYNDQNGFPINLSISTTLGTTTLNFAAPNAVRNDSVEAKLTDYFSQGKTFQLLGVEFYTSTSTGFSIFADGVAGANTGNWIHTDVSPSTGYWSQAQIRSSLSLLQRKVNTLIIQLGINLAAGEGSDTDASQAIYKHNLETIIDEWKADAEAAGGTDIKVLLINPWATAGGDGSGYPARRGVAGYQIAQERNYVSFIDLNKLMPATYGSNWASTLLADGTHQSAAGTDAIGEITWKAISGQLQGSLALPQTNQVGYQDFTNARLGVGTTSPLATLDVFGYGTTTDMLFRVSNVNKGYATTTQLVLLNSGKMGLGTSTPNNMLDVYSSTKSAIGFSGATGSTYKWTMGMDVSNGGRFSIASSTALGTLDRLVIDGNGNVGIGTTSPFSMLSVAGQVVAQNFVATSTTAVSSFGAAVGIGTTTPNTNDTLALRGSTVIDNSGDQIGTRLRFSQPGATNVDTDIRTRYVPYADNSGALASDEYFQIFRQGKGANYKNINFALTNEFPYFNPTFGTSTELYMTLTNTQTGLSDYRPFSVEVNTNTGNALGHFNGNIGIGTNGTNFVSAPFAQLQVNQITDNLGAITFPYTTQAMFTSTSTNLTPLTPKTVLALFRPGTGGGAYANIARFDIDRYVSSSQNPKTALSFRVSNATLNTEGDTTPTPLTLRSEGEVIINDNSASNSGTGTSTPITGAALAIQCQGTSTGTCIGVSNSSGVGMYNFLDNGKVGIGGLPTSNASTLQIFTNSVGNIQTFMGNATAGNGIQTTYSRSRGTFSAPTVSVAGDLISNFASQGYTGSAYATAARIRTFVDSGYAGGSTVPGRIDFDTADENTAAALAMRITKYKLVGIGTSTPAATLAVTGVDNSAVAGGDATTSLMVVGGTDTTGANAAGNGARIYLSTGPGGAGAVTSGNGGMFTITTGDGGDTSNGGTQGNSGSIYIYPGLNGLSKGNVILGANSANTAAGNIGVGTSTPWNTLSVSGTVNFSSGLGTGTTGNYICINTTTYKLTSGTTCSPSSERFKENILPMSYGLAAIQRLNPVTFTYKPSFDPDGRVRLGFIAEQVRNVLPELVSYDKDGLPESVDYAKLTPVLTNALREIGQRIDLTHAPTNIASLTINPLGNVGIGTSAPLYKLDVAGETRSLGFAVTADRNSLLSISHVSDDVYQSYLDKIKSISLSTYSYQGDATSTRLGIIADEAPSEILTANGDIDAYKLAMFTLGGVKAIQVKLDGFETRIATLEQKVNSLLGASPSGALATTTGTTTPAVASNNVFDAVITGLENLGAHISQGIAAFKSVTVEMFTVGTPDKPTGITLYDEITHQPYCLKISNGSPLPTPGECQPAKDTTTAPPVLPVTPVTPTPPVVPPPVSPVSSDPTSTSTSPVAPVDTTPPPVTAPEAPAPAPAPAPTEPAPAPAPAPVPAPAPTPAP